MAESIVFIDPDGTSWVMHDAAVTDNAVLLGIEGLFSPPFDIQGDQVPLEAGERVSQVRAERRTLLVPFRIYAASQTALRTAVRSWATRFNPLRGDATIRWSGPDGTSRDLTVRLTGGVEGRIDASGTGFGTHHQMLVLQFRASDPWWYDTITSTRTFTTADAGAFFPIFPLSLSGSEVFAEASITNGGDTYAWPTITITGPGSDPVVRNVTTGKLLDLTGVTLSSGESIEINTAPGFKTVIKNDGTNLFPSLTTDSSLWRIERGTNTLRVEMGGSTADSQVGLTYRQRWLSV